MINDVGLYKIMRTVVNDDSYYVLLTDEEIAIAGKWREIINITNEENRILAFEEWLEGVSETDEAKIFEFLNGKFKFKLALHQMLSRFPPI